MELGTKINAKTLEKKLIRAGQRAKPVLQNAITMVGFDFLSRAQGLAPKGDTSNLARSGNLRKLQGKTGVVVGFNTVYATVQDWPFPGNMVVVKPRRKKILYIPVSDRGKRHAAGRNPTQEGLKCGGIVRVAGPRPKGGATGRRDADYILAKEARIRVKPYGNDAGPNRYFSETFRRYPFMNKLKTVVRTMVG